MAMVSVHLLDEIPKKACLVKLPNRVAMDPLNKFMLTMRVSRLVAIPNVEGKVPLSWL